MEKIRVNIRTEAETKKKYDELVMRWSLATGKKMTHGEVLTRLVDDKLEEIKRLGVEKNG